MTVDRLLPGKQIEDVPADPAHDESRDEKCREGSQVRKWVGADGDDADQNEKRRIAYGQHQARPIDDPP